MKLTIKNQPTKIVYGHELDEIKEGMVFADARYMYRVLSKFKNTTYYLYGILLDTGEVINREAGYFKELKYLGILHINGVPFEEVMKSFKGEM